MNLWKLRKEPVDEAGWIVRRISELVVMRNAVILLRQMYLDLILQMLVEVYKVVLGCNEKLGDEAGWRRVIMKSFRGFMMRRVGRDVDKGKVEDKMWNMRR